MYFRFLHPPEGARATGWSENDASCVLQIRYRDTVILLPGDIERRAEQALVAALRLSRVALVIAPHHGSRTSSGPSFVAAVDPDYVVFTVQARGRWQLPHETVVRRWAQTGACLLSTAETGALVFELSVDGELKLVRRWRQHASGLWSAADQQTGLPCPASPVI